jgi:sterol desaturase/sphingolipid hydroxylase (fatty acid hydroxylase superfamily)
MESEWVVRGWRAMFEESGYPEWVVAGVGSFVLHESLYFLFHLPYLISDLIPSHQKYKVQPTKANDWPLYKRCLKQLFFSHIIIQLPLILASHPIFEFLGIKTEAELIPSWWTIIGSCVLFLIIEDFYFYWIHRYVVPPPSLSLLSIFTAVLGPTPHVVYF